MPHSLRIYAKMGKIMQNTKKPQQNDFYCGLFVVSPACKLDTS